MDSATLWLLITGGLKDPILWILGGVVGWDVGREFKRTVGYLAAAGGVWGGVRGGVYVGLGETMTSTLAFSLIAVSVALMVLFGLAVREGRVKWRDR